MLSVSRSRLVVALVATVLLTGCSFVTNRATRLVADTLAAPGTTITSDNDPELVRDAVPFALDAADRLGAARAVLAVRARDITESTNNIVDRALSPVRIVAL